MSSEDEVELTSRPRARKKLTLTVLLRSSPSSPSTSLPPCSCCVDALSALHISADFLVHYGHACLTRSSDPALRLRYVFPSLPLSISDTVDAVHSLGSTSTDAEDREKGVVLMYDVGYYWAVGELEAALKERRRIEKGKGREVIVSKIELDEQEHDVGAEDGASQPVAGSSAAAKDSLSPVSDDKTAGAACSSTPAGCACGDQAAAEPSPSCCGSVGPSPGTSCCRTTTSVPHPATLPPSSSGESHKTASLRSYTLPADKSISDYIIFYIGDGDGLAIRNLLVTHSQNQVRPFAAAMCSPACKLTPVFDWPDASGLLVHPFILAQRALSLT